MKWRGVMLGILGFAASWPLAHRAAVTAFDIDPWKFGGFAMYARPAPPLQAALLQPVEGGYRPLAPAQFTPELRRALQQFRMRRHALGSFAGTRALADVALAEIPELNAIVVMVQRMRLDPETAHMSSRSDRYVHTRSGGRVHLRIDE